MHHGYPFIGLLAAAAMVVSTWSTAGAAGSDLRKVREFPYTYVPEQRAKAELPSGRNPKIINGYYVDNGNLSWQVALFTAGAKPVDTQFCGGSLIADRWVLTAAHCVKISDEATGEVYDVTADQVDVLVGTVYLDREDGEQVKVKRIIVHEDYDPLKFDNDIALIELATPVFGPSLIALPAKDELDTASSSASELTVSGWGRTEGGDFPSQLKAAKITPASSKTCNKNILAARFEIVRQELRALFAYMGTEQAAREAVLNNIVRANLITDAMICAGVPTGERDACQGDSGGPLALHRSDGSFVQVGVVSWGEGCGEKDLYGVYTKVPAFVDWVKDKMQ